MMNMNIDKLELTSAQADVLRNVDPDTLGDELTIRALGRIDRISTALLPRFVIDIADHKGLTGFGETVRILVQYAQCGSYDIGVELPDFIGELYEVMSGDEILPEICNDPDAITPLGVVLLAACRRAKKSGAINMIDNVSLDN